MLLVRENITYMQHWKFLKPSGKCITNIAEVLLEGWVGFFVTKLNLSLKYPTIYRI